jgi:hypothetical protein
MSYLGILDASKSLYNGRAKIQLASTIFQEANIFKAKKNNV